MKKKDIILILVRDYGESLQDLKNKSKEELEELLESYEDHSDMFPNGDEYDGSHGWD